MDFSQLYAIPPSVAVDIPVLEPFDVDRIALDPLLDVDGILDNRGVVVVYGLVHILGLDLFHDFRGASGEGAERND